MTEKEVFDRLKAAFPWARDKILWDMVKRWARKAKELA